MDASLIFDFLNTGISAALNFFSTLVTASGMLPYYSAFVVIFIICRFLLTPLFGSSGSDKVKKPKEDDDG